MEPSVLHLVNRFAIGGAERQFIERLRAHPPGFRPLVGCLEVSGGNVGDFLELGLQPPRLFPTRGSLMRVNTLVQVARIAALVREERVRIVHATEFVTNLLGLLAARATGARVVVSRVDLGHLRAGFGLLHRWTEKRISAAADFVCANAEAVRRLCIAEEGCDPERVLVVRNGIDLARFDRLAADPLQGPLPKGAPLVVVVANLWPVKGHASFLEAAALVRARVPAIGFALVGDGPERPHLERRAKDLGLSGCVHFLGLRHDVPAVLSRANIACLPSKAEGLSNALMEAMAARLPAIATAVGGNAELVVDGETGLLVPPQDPAALAGAIYQLASDGPRAAAMGARGRARAERELSLQGMQQNYLALYGRLLDLPAAAAAPA